MAKFKYFTKWVKFYGAYCRTIFEISKKCCYYSLGLLVVFLIMNKYLLVGNEFKTSKEIDNIIQPLYNTKIYWFLKRCLDDDINNRKLLLV